MTPKLAIPIGGIRPLTTAPGTVRIPSARFHSGNLRSGLKRVDYRIIGRILASEIYDFLRKVLDSAHYFMWLGVKLSLTLLPFAAAIPCRDRQGAFAATGASVEAIEDFPRVSLWR